MTAPSEFTCNGYDSYLYEGNWTYEISVHGQVEQLQFNKISAYISYLNGDMTEVNTGTVTGGRCAGDIFFRSSAYIADDQDGCACNKGVASLTMRYVEARLSGPKCGPTACTLEYGHILLDPPVCNY